ncbi:MAG: Gfo/Idh/MocA family oxidoreductase, partial [Planctomycetes bacterium]|nr:Gfo/Idh/MocA family oxidoreductase [Planctomycetota bacterium]
MKPVRLLVVGAGRRFRTIFQPILNDCSEFLKVCAVYDPQREAADSLAGELQCLGSDDLSSVIGEVEAALICTPIHSHYGLTAFLLQNGIHCHTETQWCSTVKQAKHLVALAQEQNLIANVAEMFPHMPQDVFARAIRDRGDIGSINRIFSYGANANYHNSARWAFWTGRAPDTVQAQAHDMNNSPVTDRWVSRQFSWDNELLVIDQRAGLNGSLGRG